MYKMLDAKILDKNAEYLGLNLEKFMDNAGIAVANTVLSMNADKILVVCGSGNNGGDGYVSAIHLKKIGKKVDILKVKEPKSPLCIKKYNDAISNNINFVEDPDFSQYDVIVDAMLGIGISKTPEEPYKTIIEKMNRYGKKIVSVDVPTGIGTSLQVNPHITVTMQFMKEEMNKENSGEIIVADVGFPKEVIEMIGPGDFLAYKENASSSHKGENGVLIAIAGSIEYYGAPIYMVKGALRTGVDLVFLFSPSKIHNYISSATYDIILRKSGENYIEYTNEMDDLITNKSTAISLGCGIGKNEKSLESSIKIIERALKIKKPIVIDADALYAVSNFDDFSRNAVITPHRGEFKKLFSLDPDENNVVKVAKKYSLVILLKGPIDIVTDGEIVKKNREFHHPSMTRGGTGDILTGVVGGLLSRGIDPLHSASLGSFISGSAGKITYEEKGNSYYTSEILKNIPKIFKKYYNNF